MSRRVFVDNFKFDTTQESLSELFKGSGQVESVEIPADRFGKAYGHAVVVMSSDSGALTAIRALNDFNWNGLKLTVTKATAPHGRPAGFSGGLNRLERKNR